MNNRLRKIISLISRDSIGIADIGTDHGYLPIELARNGFKGYIFASDIRQKPLNTAIQNARFYDVYDNIAFSLSNGLDNCDPSLIDTIIIAGMGGDMICDIIDRAEWTMDYKYHIFLQSMSKTEILRYWLVNNGYSILCEYPVLDMGRNYTIIEVRFTGNNEKYSDAELYVGKCHDKLLIQSTIKSLSKKPYSAFYDGILKELKKYES